jgi:hypothetical protein
LILRFDDEMMMMMMMMMLSCLHKQNWKANLHRAKAPYHHHLQKLGFEALYLP